jgi:twitching motility protein PilT
MEHIIKAAVERGASDLHIKAGDVFRARIDGVFKPLTKQRLTPEQTKAIALQLIPNEADRERIDSIRDYDCSWGAPGIGRFRVNLLRQRSSFMVVMRAIPFNVPTTEVLQLPPVIGRIAEADRGLVLVTGPAGNGKSSTIAAMIHQINSTMSKHVITLENPIEFLHRDVQSSVTQREVGVDTESLKVGARAALRQDPDVIFVSELVDHEIASTVMQAGETGSLIISTFHAPDVASAVGRMVTLFPSEEQEVARMRLADTLHAVVAQRLVPRADGEGRVAVLEVMICTPEIREVIRNRNRAGELHGMLESGKGDHQTQTFDQHLKQLVQEKTISVETATATATDPSIFEPAPPKRRRSKKGGTS